MYKTIVIEGGDGVGKSTLAKALSKNLSHREGYEGFFMRFPSEAVEGFREFFLRQKGCRPLLEDNEVRWSSTYTSNIPPLTNLLHILADFSYVFSALPNAPDVVAAHRRGNTPVFVIDRELISTIVYQILYAFDLGKAEFDYVVEEKVHLFEVMKNIVASTPVDTTHNLLVHIRPENDKIKLTTDNSFDLYDQPQIQKHFADMYEAIVDTPRRSLSFLHQNDNIEWLRNRFLSTTELQAFSDSSEALAEQVAEIFLEKEREFASGSIQ